MRVPLTERLIEEVERYTLRSACPHCLYSLAASGECLHEWPNDEQRHFPVDAPVHGEVPKEVGFCKEFELR